MKSYFGVSIVRVLLAGLGCWLFPQQASLAATMPPVHVQFIDAESEQPITNANVIFYATSKQGTLTGDGGSTSILFLVEGVTNKTGTIDIPAQSFWPVPFLLGSNNSMPTMHMYKNGYELASLMGYGRYPASVNDIASWANVYTKPIKVKRARTTLDLFEAVRAADSIAENLYQSTTDPCAWQKIPRFFLAVERGANDWKSRPKEEGWYRQQRTYDRELKNPVADLINSEEKDRRLFDCDKPSDVFKNFQDSEQ